MINSFALKPLPIILVGHPWVRRRRNDTRWDRDPIHENSIKSRDPRRTLRIRRWVRIHRHEGFVSGRMFPVRSPSAPKPCPMMTTFRSSHLAWLNAAKILPTGVAPLHSKKTNTETSGSEPLNPLPQCLSEPTSRILRQATSSRNVFVY